MADGGGRLQMAPSTSATPGPATASVITSRHHRQNSIFQGAILRDNHAQRPSIKVSRQPSGDPPTSDTAEDYTRKRKAEDEPTNNAKKKSKTSKRAGKNGVRLVLKWQSQLADGDTGNYWYLGKEEFEELSPERQGHWTHVGRLLFAGDGVQPIRCEKHGIDCVVYSKAALEIAENLPKRCAGCLSQNRSGCKPVVGDETEDDVGEVKQEGEVDVKEEVDQEVVKTEEDASPEKTLDEAEKADKAEKG
ncbi:hypothetical protein LTR53_001930 [Teratosphaeriaceae sp. CCFEE 6253]|nr:hypothetical protein LTR53_001930 [Teratosphaeriaceae sp. CCFEE 6253]